MFTLDLTNGGAPIGSVGFVDQGSSKIMTLDTQSAVHYFKKITILKTNIVNNALGLYSFQRPGVDGKVRFANFTTPKHLLQARKNGCVWTPKGVVSTETNEFSVNPVEANMENCPDALLGACLEGVLGTGNDIRNFFGTDQGRALFAELLRVIYMGLGNSFYELLWYGQHPLIASASANDTYSVPENQWDDYVDQQQVMGGFMTIIDWFKSDGLSNFNVQILDDEISADKTEYLGTASDLFDRVLKEQAPVMKLASKQGLMNSKSILLVDGKIFDKYEKDIMLTWNTIPDTMYYMFDGKFCQAVGCDSTMAVEGILKYKGHLVVRMDEWEDFDTMTGTNTFRCLAVAPGVFGVGYDVADLKQFSGQGLRVVQHLEAPYQGKIFMDTTFKVGAGVIDETFIVNASRTFTPSA